jgi:hypothetical protein
MSALATAHRSDASLTVDVLDHLDTQLVAVRRLLQIVLEQGAAIRRRDVQHVVRLAGILQAEIERRKQLDDERMRLLERAGARLGVTATSVTLSLLERLMDPGVVLQARTRSSELAGLLAEVQREHACNRALMSQELAFLDHLLRLVDDGPGAYNAGGERPTTPTSRQAGRRGVLNLEA